MRALDELRLVLVQAQAAIQEGLRIVGEHNGQVHDDEDEHD